MRATVTFQTDDGALHELSHGHLIGRLWSARLQLSRPDISEAHALVSLRGGDLHLLALRGLFALNGKPLKDLILEEGQRIWLSREVSLQVVEVSLPDDTLGLEGDGLITQPLSGVSSLRLAPRPALTPGHHPGADAVFFMANDAWQVQTSGGVQPLEPGWHIGEPGAQVRAVCLPLHKAGLQPTRALGRVNAPLRIEAHFDQVYIHRDGQPTVGLTGHAARLITDLGQAGTALPWEALAEALWKDAPHRDLLRKRFDGMLSRTRRRLRQEGLSPDLLSTDGGGNVSLVLRPEDSFDDRS